MKARLLCSILLAVASIAFLPSCKKSFLEKQPQSDLTTGSFYKSPADAESALIGAYSSLHKQYYIWDYQINQDARSDNCYAGGDNPDNFQIDNFQLTATNNNVLRDWQDLYASVMTANAVIDNVPQISDELWQDPNRKNQIIAEAKFLRALHYFNLVTTWGDVPLVLSLKDDLYKSRAKTSDVYAQIEKDLLDAEATLPATFNSDAETHGRATKGGAQALLAKVYAQEGKYEQALDYASRVIASNTYSLLPNFDELFDGSHKNTSESIFEIQYDANGLGDWGIQLLTPKSLTGDEWIKFNTPTHDLVRTYRAEGDSVRLHTSIIFEATPNLPSPYTPGELVPYIYKWRHPNGWNSPDNVIMIRLADIILLKAEALNNLGRPTEAIPLVNQIRARVHLPNTTATSQAEVKEAILKERRLELAFEGQRWNDLLRAGTDYTINVMHNQRDGRGNLLSYNVTPQKLVFPIPQNDLNLNKNLTQNPGY
jgi:tetratricopeptide (TPR) repeat protein